MRARAHAHTHTQTETVFACVNIFFSTFPCAIMRSLPNSDGGHLMRLFPDLSVSAVMSTSQKAQSKLCCESGRLALFPQLSMMEETHFLKRFLGG
jgi:hypothetical protein